MPLSKDVARIETATIAITSSAGHELSHAENVSVSQMRLDLNFSSQLVLHAGLGQLLLRKNLLENVCGHAKPTRDV